MKSTYSVVLEGVLPVLARISVEANSEWEAGILAERIAECQRNGVKTRALDIEIYPADYFIAEGVAEITTVEPENVSKVWKRDEIGQLLGKTTS
jgi:hypothetical protein